MSLEYLRVISTSVSDKYPNHIWDKNVLDEILNNRNRKLKKLLLGVSTTANLAFSLGVAEWLVRRMEDHVDCKETLQYMEALWAWIIDYRYLKKEKINHRSIIDDRLKGPVNITNSRLYMIFSDCRRDDPDRISESVELVNVVRHVLEKTNKFDQWVLFALERLNELQPYDMGRKIVPRQTIDPDIEYTKAQGVQYLNTFLSNTTPEENPYLANPDDLIEAGFEGKPYQFIL